MPWIYAFFALILLGCSGGAFSSPQAVGVGSAGTVGAGGQSGQGGASAAAGGTATGGRSVGSSGAAGITGGAGGSAGAPAGSIHVDVVPGVQTDCVFPSAVVPPDFTACEPEDVGLPVGYCATPTNTHLPITLSALVWDYSTLTLTATLTTNSSFRVGFGPCASPTSCDYKLEVHAPMPPDPPTITVTMKRTDRGYVMTNIQGMGASPIDSSCSDSYGQGNVNLCVQNGYWRSWAAWTVPCAH